MKNLLLYILQASVLLVYWQFNNYFNFWIFLLELVLIVNFRNIKLSLFNIDFHLGFISPFLLLLFLRKFNTWDIGSVGFLIAICIVIGINIYSHIVIRKKD